MSDEKSHSSQHVGEDQGEPFPVEDGPEALNPSRPGHYVHPGAVKMIKTCPCTPKIPVFGRAIEGYGPKLVFSLTAAYFLCKGIADQIIGFSLQPMMMKRFGLDATRYQRLASLYTMGWSIKAFIAVITDTFPLFHYTKRWYMLGSCILGAAFALAYGLLPAQPSSGNPAAAFIFLTSFGKANVDILSEGHYSRLIRRNPKPGPSLVSSIWVVILVGTLIASAIQGPLSDDDKIQIGVFISATLQLATGIIFIFNFYGEKVNREERLQDLRDHRAAVTEAKKAANVGSLAKEEADADKVVKDLHPEKNTPEVDRELQLNDEAVLDDAVITLNGEEEDEDCNNAEEDELYIPSCLWGTFEFNEEMVTRNWKVVVYSCVMTACVVTMVCVTILGTTWDLMYAAIVISVVCIICAFLTLPLVIAKANVYTYVFFVLYLQIPGGVDSFYLADPSCVPGGPHFSYVFYNTVGAIIQNIGGIFGIVLFNYIFSKMQYQVTMCVAISLQVIASVFDIVMVERWNIYIGIPDHAMYICGDAIVYQICYMLSYMPIVLLMSRLCPRGSESMIYALIAGFSNLGQTMSNAIGSILVETVWPIDSTSVPCDFSNLRWLLITGHLVMPLINVPLSFLLLPRVRICDDIDVNGKAIKKQLKKEKEGEKEGEWRNEPDDEEGDMVKDGSDLNSSGRRERL